MSVFKSVEFVDIFAAPAGVATEVNLTKGQDPTQCTPFYSTKQFINVNDAHDQRINEIEFFDNAGTPAVRVSADARAGAGNNVLLFVVEWDPSISVQQVPVTTLTGSTVNVTIDDVFDQSTAFLIYSYQFTEPPASDDDWNDAAVRVRFNGSSTVSVTLSRIANGGTCNGTLYVVKCSNTEFIVDHQEIVAGLNDATVTAIISATVPADTFLLCSYDTSVATDDMLNGAWQHDLQDATTLRLRRTNGGSPAAISTHNIAVVECQNNEWDVQRNDALTLDAATKTDSIIAIDQTRSIINCLDHTGHPFSVGRNNSLTGTEIDDIQAAADFSADDVVRYRKRITTLTNDIVSYEVIQFGIVTSVSNDIIFGSGGLHKGRAERIKFWEDRNELWEKANAIKLA